MSWTKRDLVIQAFEEIGYASYIYDAMPEQLDSVLRTLDAMMGAWNAIGIRVGYPISSSPSDSDIDQITDVTDSAIEAIYTNLAIRIGPRFGKSIPQETRQIAKQGYDALLVKLSMPEPMQFPNTLPVGAGNKPWRTAQRPYMNNPVDPLLADNGNDIELFGAAEFHHILRTELLPTTLHRGVPAG